MSFGFDFKGKLALYRIIVYNILLFYLVINDKQSSQHFDYSDVSADIVRILLDLDAFVYGSENKWHLFATWTITMPTFI